MALTKRHMQTIILRNGHLQLDGTELVEDLRMALIYLRSHTWNRCAYPDRGIPIESLIPDISVLAVKSTKKGNARTRTVDTTGERL